MGYLDFPLVVRSGDPRRFPSHGEVLAYLQDFAKEFAIEEMIRFETAVESEGGNRKWRVESTETEKRVRRDEVYDAVVVCSGHYTEPRLADIPGNLKLCYLCHFKNVEEVELHRKSGT